MSTAATRSKRSANDKATAKNKRAFDEITDNNRDDGTTASDAVAKHYDRRAKETTAERRQCRVLPLRNANNGAKAQLISDALWRAQQRIEQEEQQGNLQQRRRPIYVLDLGCGKGGDLLKYARASEALDVDIVYYGVDLSADSIAEARRRAVEQRGRLGRLIEVDFAQGDFCAVANDALKREWLTADIVSVQFALHYAFESETIVRKFFDNCARALARNGEMIGTVVDQVCLDARLAAASVVTNSDDAKSTGRALSFGNSLYSVAFEKKKEGNQNKTGVRYRFALDGCIDDCDEYVVDRDYLRSMASVIGLDLKIWLPIRCLYAARDTLALNADLEQREISDLYAAFVFARPFALNQQAE